MIVVWNQLLKNTKITGIALYPFIVLRNKKDRLNRTLINHEKIHLRQQLELLVVFFYLWYVIEYYYWYVKLGNSHLAYRTISFEREAFAKEEDSLYLKNRPFWNFLRFFYSH